MPYEGQFASKSAHSDFLRNPDIKDFLGECEYLTPPSDEEAQKMDLGRFDQQIAIATLFGRGVHHILLLFPRQL